MGSNLAKNKYFDEDSNEEISSPFFQKVSFNKQFSKLQVLHSHTIAYKYATRNFSLIKEKWTICIHYLFRDDALIFYEGEIEGNFTSLGDALRRIQKN